MIALIAILATLTSAPPPPPISYTCTGGTVYTIPFPYIAASQVIATQTTAAGVVTTVTGTVKPSIAPTSGTLTLGTACPSGSTLTITRSVPLTQPQSFRTGNYSGPAHEQAFDRLAMQIQQLNAKEVTDLGVVNNTVAAFNASGAVIGSTTSVLALGSSTPRTLAARFAETINAKDYGAKCDDTTDDTAALQAALNAIGPSGTARDLVIPLGNCVVTGTLTVSGFVGVTIRGLGYGSILKWKGNATGPMFSISGTRESTLTDIRLQPATASFPIASVIVQEQPPLISGLTSTMNTYRRVQIAGLGVVTQGVYIKGDVTDANNDFNNFEQVFVNGYTEAGILIQGANSFSNRILNCQFGGGLVAHYGIKAINGAGGEAGHFSVFGGATLGHTTADIYIQSNSSLPYVIDNLYSETSTAFLIEDGVIGTRNSTVIRGVKFASSNVGASPVISIKNPGPVLLENSFIGTDFTKSPTVLWTYAAGFSPPSFRVVNSRFRGTLTSLAAIFNATPPTFVSDSFWATSTTVSGLLDRWSFDAFGKLTQTGVIFAQLGTPANGTLVYCPDCTVANPCAGAGTGAFAKRLNGAWVCN